LTSASSLFAQAPVRSFHSTNPSLGSEEDAPLPDFKTAKSNALQALDDRDIDIGLNADCRAYAKEMGLQIKGTQDDVVTVERKTKTHIWTIEFSIDAEAKEPIQEQEMPDEEENKEADEEEEQNDDGPFDEHVFTLTMTPIKKSPSSVTLQLSCKATADSDLLIESIQFNPESENPNRALDMASLDAAVRDHILDFLDSMYIDSRLPLYVQHVAHNERNKILDSQLKLVKAFIEDVQV